MKKPFLLFWTLLAITFQILALFVLTTAIAEQPQFTIRDLSKQAAMGWHQSYQAYGRTIQVDMDILVPDVETAPVLLVKRMPAFVEPFLSQLSEKYKNTQNDPKSYYVFDSDAIASRTAYANKYPFVLDEADGETMLTVSWPNRALMEYDWNQAYADNSPLTVQEAFDIAVERFHDVFDESISIVAQDIGLEDRYYDKKTGEPIREKGGYLFMCRQVFHGIPHAVSVKRTFKNFRDDITDGEKYYNDFFVRTAIVDAESYCFDCSLLQETAVVYKDIPLLSFDPVKTAIEDLIKKGNIRNVYSVQLSYVLYDNPDDLNNSYILVPSWVAWCEYYKTAKDEMSEFDKNSMYFDTAYYHPIIVNAQTGVLINPMSEASDRGRCSAIIPW